MTKTIWVAQESAANGLALNKDFSHVVIAGRSVFKIFRIDEDEFVEICNLRVGKNLNLNFSCSDVAWNVVDDHILATAATNGAVVVWNLSRPSRSKQEHVFADHHRTANKVSFNPAEPSWLISGSQDGTMRTFDLRTKAVTNVFYSNTESVRDVQFSPHSHTAFASVSDNGSVQTWDMRRPDRYVLQFTGHSGPIFACDWHPDSPWLATASRDKTIKVWDMSKKPELEQTVNTIASVARVKWRPQHAYHIASVALVVDSSVNVWDIRRPYIPLAAFTSHKDTATGIAWRGDPNVLLTTSRDCTLYQHVFKDAIEPAARVNPHALCFSPQGVLAFACKDSTGAFKAKAANSKKINASDEFCYTTSCLTLFSKVVDREMDWFLACAERYVITGRPLADICDHNAEVAKSLGRLAVSLIWSTIKTVYTARLPDFSNFQINLKEDQVDGLLDGSKDNKQKNDSVNENGVEGTRNDESGRRESGAMGDSVGDFCFGDAEMDPLSMEFEINGLDGLITQDWTLQTEAFPLRHEIQDRSPPPEQFPEQPLHLDESDSVRGEKWGGLTWAEAEGPACWDHREILAEALRTHALAGDVQTPACVLTALGSQRRSLLAFIEPHEQQTWILAYLDLLSQNQLWNHSNEIIKLCWLSSVNQMNQQSTTVYTSCGVCNKSMPQSRRSCSHCGSGVVCSVCHETVNGPYVWCQGCSHGGHLLHVTEWLSTNNECPSGCGHFCQYS